MKDNILLEKILDEKNFNIAIKHVIANNGCSGYDGVTVKEFPILWELYCDNIINLLKEGNYKPEVYKTTYVSKNNGTKEKRKLTIPTVLDRVIQQAILNVLEPYYERKFHQNSYGYRKGIKVEELLKKCLVYFNQGYTYIADIDIKTFFDNINHNVLLELLSKDIHDERVLDLIAKILNGRRGTGMYIHPIKVGVGQGGPLSSLFANIVLNNLDWVLYENNIKFIRYADDIIICAKNKEEASRYKYFAEYYLNNHLKLSLNQEKSGIIPVEELEYMGYAFFKDKTGEIKLRVSDKAIEKAKKRFNRIIHNKYDSEYEWWNMIGAFNRGWLNYFKYAEIKSLKETINILSLYEVKLMNNWISQHNELKISMFDSKGFTMLEDWHYKLIERKA